jgi:hypothetical protein
MANRMLNAEELEKANRFLDRVREQIKELSGDDRELEFAYNRKI